MANSIAGNTSFSFAGNARTVKKELTLNADTRKPVRSLESGPVKRLECINGRLIRISRHRQALRRLKQFQRDLLLQFSVLARSILHAEAQPLKSFQ